MAHQWDPTHVAGASVQFSDASGGFGACGARRLAFGSGAAPECNPYRPNTAIAIREQGSFLREWHAPPTAAGSCLFNERHDRERFRGLSLSVPVLMSAGRLVSAIHWSDVHSSWHVTYDHDDGQVTRSTARRLDLNPSPPPVFTEEWVYDLGYGYDRSFNLTSVTDHLTATTRTFEVDGNDQLLPEGTGPGQFHFDANGNLASDGERTFAWDALNRLVVSTRPGSSPSVWAHDPFGRLVLTTTSSSEWRAWSGWTLDHETTLGGPGLERHHGHVGGMRPTGHVNAGEGYVHHDGNVQGSREEELGTGYSPIWDPFGRIAEGAMPEGSRQGFQGQEWREEVEAYAMRHRWYDPELGRFLSPDPVLSGVVNNYQFALNDPVGKWDPMGLVTAVYEQATGRLTWQSDDRMKGGVLRCFAGSSARGARNDPARDGDQSVGPLPAAMYGMSLRGLEGAGLRNWRRLSLPDNWEPRRIDLTCIRGNSCRRDALQIHSDFWRGADGASEGCIACPPSQYPELAHAVEADGGGELIVIHGLRPAVRDGSLDLSIDP